MNTTKIFRKLAKDIGTRMQKNICEVNTKWF